ncbi:hypothetical protein [Amycolatopsis sp. GA6-003]|uniref:hypothetical protein n=1 Tax=Amycolatopsis sp. GA6-003 TaxID=2652444 RepID=UPI00391722A8
MRYKIDGQESRAAGQPLIWTACRSAYQAVGPGLADLAVSPDDGTVFTASGSRDHVEASTTKDFSRAGAYRAGQYPNAVAVGAVGTHVAAGLRDTDIYFYRPGALIPIGG